MRDEGEVVGRIVNLDDERCKMRCDLNSLCHSFTFCTEAGGECILRDKVLNGNEATRQKQGCTTYYRINGQ